MKLGADPSLFHYNLLRGGYILMCEHVGLGGHALFTKVAGQTPSTLTRRKSRGAWRAESTKLKTWELTFPLGGESE